MKILGIDTGPVFVSIVLINGHGYIMQSSNSFHEGKITKKTTSYLKNLGLKDLGANITTTNSNPGIISQTITHKKRSTGRI